MDISPASDDTPSDKTLMLAYAGGDTEAFETLYQRHRRGLYRYVLHSCGNEADTAEIYQDIWLKVVKTIIDNTERSTLKSLMNNKATSR